MSTSHTHTHTNNSTPEADIHNISLVNACTSLFCIPKHLQDRLEKYYILHWEPKHFLDQIHTGRLWHQEVEYLVIYQDCNPMNIRSEEQIKLSFRKPANFRYGYVIVRRFP